MSVHPQGTRPAGLRLAGSTRSPGDSAGISQAGGNTFASTAQQTDVYTGGLQDLIVPAGMHVPNTAGAGGYQVPNASDTLYAIPFFVDFSRTLANIINRQNSATGTPGLGHWGIYSNISGGLYPNALLYDSGEITFNGNQRYIVSPGLSMSAVTWYWMVSLYDAQMFANNVTIFCVNDFCLPALGTPSDLTTGGGPTVYTGAWRHALAYGALPSTFPTSAPVRITRGGGILYPTNFLRWSA